MKGVTEESYEFIGDVGTKHEYELRDGDKK